MRRMRVKKILSALTGLLFAASAHADYLRDLHDDHTESEHRNGNVNALECVQNDG